MYLSSVRPMREICTIWILIRVNNILTTWPVLFLFNLSCILINQPFCACTSHTPRYFLFLLISYCLPLPPILSPPLVFLLCISLSRLSTLPFVTFSSKIFSLLNVKTNILFIWLFDLSIPMGQDTTSKKHFSHKTISTAYKSELITDAIDMNQKK